MKYLVKTPLSPYSGYGSDGIGILRALVNAGHDVYVQPEHVDAPLPADVAYLLTKRLEAPFDVLLHHTDPGQFGLSPEARQAATKTVGWSMWESSTLDNLKNRRLLPKKMATYDMILGYDQVAVDAFRPYVRKSKLEVLQGGFWSEEWKPVERDWFSDRFGFAQPLTAKVLTPIGWRLMGDLVVGDQVMSPSGDIQKVEAITPRGKQQVYEIEFKDGSVARSTGDHLWKAKHCRDSEFGVYSLSQILARGLRDRSTHAWEVPVVEPMDLEEIDLPVDPYLLGLLLGDGWLGSSNQGPTLVTVDAELSAACVRLADSPVRVRQEGHYSRVVFAAETVETVAVCRYPAVKHSTKIVARGLCGSHYNKVSESDRHLYAPTRQETSLKTALQSLGLWAVRGSDKFVPEVYLRGSYEQRLRLLRGLMDSDGTYTKRAGSFVNRSENLVKAVAELVRSLGGSARVCHYAQNKAEWSVSVNTSVNPFALKRKARQWHLGSLGRTRRYRKTIKAIRLVNVEDVQCITVTNADGLYVTDDYTVTHNCMVGQLHERKDPFAAIQAFQELKTELPEEFEQAELHLKNNLPTLHPAMENWIPKLRVHYAIWPQDILYKFYGKQHVLLAPSRGEGKNLPALEFQATGGAVIATNWGGHVGWLDPSFAYPLNYSMAPVDNGHPNCLQARADKDHLKELMLHVYRNRAEVKRKGELASSVISRSMNWDAVIERLGHKVSEL